MSQPDIPTGRRRIVVIGSINMDLVFRVPRLPGAGETVLGRSFAVIPGGKGANQGVAAARLGGEAHLITAGAGGRGVVGKGDRRPAGRATLPGGGAETWRCRGITGRMRKAGG